MSDAAARYDEFHMDGYWWALSLRDGGDEPEIIDVASHPDSRLANRMAADGDMYELAAFVPLKPVDTAGWPAERTLSMDEYLAEDRAFDQDTVEDGYWCAFHFMEEQPEIVRVGRASGVLGDKVAYWAGSAVEPLASFEFVMKIDTGGWPRPSP